LFFFASNLSEQQLFKYLSYWCVLFGTAMPIIDKVVVVTPSSLVRVSVEQFDCHTIFCHSVSTKCHIVCTVCCVWNFVTVYVCTICCHSVCTTCYHSVLRYFVYDMLSVYVLYVVTVCVRHVLTNIKWSVTCHQTIYNITGKLIRLIHWVPLKGVCPILYDFS